MKINRIKGLSDKRRLPRLGKIRLGFKLKSSKGSEYPAELPFFLLPPEVAKLFGFKSPDKAVQRAKEMGVERETVLKFIAENAFRMSEDLAIMFPIDDEFTLFPQAYKRYGASKGVLCIGDGERAMSINEMTKDMTEVDCPCSHMKGVANPKGDCVQRAHLQFMIPNVSMGGVYQIDIGSYHSIIDCNSGFDFTRGLLGRIALVPLKLRRIAMPTNHEGKRIIHYTLQILCDVPAHELEGLRRDSQRILLTQTQYALPAPEDINPAKDDGGDVVVIDADEQEPGGTEPEADTVETETADEPAVKQSPKEMIENALTINELKAIWESIPSPKSKDLGALKDKKKAAIKASIIERMEIAQSLDELDGLMGEADGFDGTSKTEITRAHDKRATALRETNNAI